MRHVTLLCAAAMLALAPVAPAYAQAKMVAASSHVPRDMTKTQRAQLQTLFADFDKKVSAGFVGETALRAVMTKELKAIEAIKDPKSRTAAIAAYQSKYATNYRRILKKGGADLYALAAAMGRLLTGRKFTVVNGTHITAIAIDGDGPAGNLTLPATSSSQTLNLGTADFAFSHDPGCGGIAGSGGTFANMKLKVETWSAIVGGCENSAALLHEYVVPANNFSQTTLRVTITTDAFAVGVLGISRSSTRAMAYLQEKGIQVISGNLLIAESDALAPLLWVVSDPDTEQTYPMSMTLGSGRTVVIGGSVSASTQSALGAGTNTNGTIELVNPTIVVTAQ